MGNCRSRDDAWLQKIDASSPGTRRPKMGYEQSIPQSMSPIPLHSRKSSFADSTAYGCGYTYDDYSLSPGGGLTTISSKSTSDDRAYLDTMFGHHRLTENQDDVSALAPPSIQEDPGKNGYRLTEPYGFRSAQCTALTDGYSRNNHTLLPPLSECDGHRSYHRLSVDDSLFSVHKTLLEIENENEEAMSVEKSKRRHRRKRRHSRDTTIARDANDDADEDGNLILHHACIWGANAELIKELIDSNPDAIYVKNKKGETPLHIARKDDRKSHIVSIIERFESQKRIEELKKMIRSDSDSSINADCAGVSSSFVPEENPMASPRSDHRLPASVVTSNIQLRVPLEEDRSKPSASTSCDNSIYSNADSAHKTPPSLVGTDNYSPRSVGKHSACSNVGSSAKSLSHFGREDVINSSPSSLGTSSICSEADLLHKTIPLFTDVDVIDFPSKSRSMPRLFLQAGLPHCKVPASMETNLVAYAPKTLPGTSVYSFSDESFMTAQSGVDFKMKVLEAENSDLKHKVEDLTDKLDGIVRVMEKMMAAQRFLIEQQVEGEAK